jgi:hypothetical protein
MNVVSKTLNASHIYMASIDTESLHQTIADAIVAGVHVGNPLHTDGVISNAWGGVKKVFAPAPLPFWLKIDGKITQEEIIIKTAFENKRSISDNELQEIMDIRKERNVFVFNKFFNNEDPRTYRRSCSLSSDGTGAWDPVDSVKTEIAKRTKYRNEHPAVPGGIGRLNPVERESTIRSENEYLRKTIAYWSRTKYSGMSEFFNKNMIANRKRKTIGMELWNAIIQHDSLTESCFARTAGARTMSISERDKLQDSVDDLKFLVRILTMDLT